IGWVCRRRPVTCSAKVGRTARSRAPSWVVTTTPSGRPMRSSCWMSPVWIECFSPTRSRTRWRLPTLSIRRITSPSVMGLSEPPPGLRPASPAIGEAKNSSIRFVGSDERVPVRVEELAVPPLRVKLLAGYPLGRLDDRGKLGGHLGTDRHVAHPLLVVPVELLRLGRLDFESRSLELGHPLFDGEGEDVGRVAAQLDLVQQVARRLR